MTTHATITEPFEFTSCCSCGVVFGMPEELLAARHKDGKSFWCPNGHSMSYRETEADKLRKRLEQAERTEALLRNQRDRASADRDIAERSARAYRGVATKLRNRAQAGQCIHCELVFADLKAHMATDHPHADGVEAMAASSPEHLADAAAGA